MLPEEDWSERQEAGTGIRNTAIPKDGVPFLDFFFFYSPFSCLHLAPRQRRYILLCSRLIVHLFLNNV